MNIQDAIKAEKEIQKQVQEIKDKIAIEVCDGNYSKTAIIPFSALDRCILSASYYIQASQAEIVEKKLNFAKEGQTAFEWRTKTWNAAFEMFNAWQDDQSKKLSMREFLERLPALQW